MTLAGSFTLNLNWYCIGVVDDIPETVRVRKTVLPSCVGEGTELKEYVPVGGPIGACTSPTGMKKINNETAMRMLQGATLVCLVIYVPYV